MVPAPKIHFIIPCYRGSKSISTCIQSILSQSYPQELIQISVIENGIPDNIQTIVEEYGQCRYYYNPQKGRSEARNFLLPEIKEEFVAFVDVDVILDTHWLAESIGQLTSPYIAAVTGRISRTGNSYIDKFRHRMGLLATAGSENFLLDKNGIGTLNTAAILFRTHVLKSIKGFDTAFTRCEDFELTQRLLQCGYILSATDKAKATVAWDRGAVEYLFARFFMNGYFSAIVYKLYKKPTFPFWGLYSPKKLLYLYQQEGKLFLLFWIITKTNFVLGFTLGRLSKKDFNKELPKGALKIFVEQQGNLSLYRISNLWNVLIVNNELTLFNNSKNSFYFFKNRNREFTRSLILNGLAVIQTKEDYSIIDQLVDDKIILKMNIEL